MKTAIAALCAVSFATAADAGPEIPPEIVAQVPAGYDVLGNAVVAAGRPRHDFAILALGRHDETDKRWRHSPVRPLLIFERKGGHFALVGRNDTVVLKADDGLQCDPFIDSGATIATRGSYFTVENGVACGQHWTIYVTFRFDDKTGGFVFDNERSGSWRMNTDPDGEALVRDTPVPPVRDRPGHVTPFAAWRSKQ